VMEAVAIPFRVQTAGESLRDVAFRVQAGLMVTDRARPYYRILGRLQLSGSEVKILL
jgi:hypothetical protein